METVLSSKTKTVVISPDRPFAIIGERINPTGRKKLAEELSNGDFSRVQSDALAQVEAGAAILDVNAGVPGGDEPAIMRQAVQMVMETVDVPLSIDSANPDALEAGLADLPGQGADQLHDRRGRGAGARAAPGQEVRRGGHRAVQRRARSRAGPARAPRDREEDRGAGGGPRRADRGPAV